MDSFIDTIGLGGALAILAALGAVLGSAIGHWFGRRHSGRIVSGAIVGAILLPLAGLALLVHVTALLVSALALAAAVVLGGFLG